MHSQQHEEQIIRDILSGLGLSTGVFLDIGAFDGKTFSNTYALAEAGWTGTLVEPNPSSFVGLMKTYEPILQRWEGSTRAPILVNACVAEYAPGEPLTLFWSSPDLVSSANPEHVAKWRKAAPFTPIHLCSVGLAAILALHHRTFGDDLHVVSIDTEGSSRELLKEFFSARGEHMGVRYPYRPAVAVVEHDSYGDEIREFMVGSGYHLVDQTAQNQVYRKAD